MKIPIYSLRVMLIAILLTAIVGCSKDDLAGGDDSHAVGELLLTVVDGGYASSDGTLSRTTDNGYTTTFTEGDKIGFYSVKSGAVVADNVCLTAKTVNGSLVWEAPTGVVITNLADHFFVYYPYQATLNGNLTPTATTADDFFAGVIASWTPATDQSSYTTGYTASDLMVGKGSLGTTVGASGKFPLTVTLNHKMGLVVITLPKEVTNVTSSGFKPLTKTTASSTVTGEYHYLVKPTTETTLAGIFTHYTVSRQYSIKATVAGGTYNTYNVSGRTWEIGDPFPDSINTIGVVFFIENGGLHGRAVSLDQYEGAAAGAVSWGQNKKDGGRSWYSCYIWEYRNLFYSYKYVSYFNSTLATHGTPIKTNMWYGTMDFLGNNQFFTYSMSDGRESTNYQYYSYNFRASTAF